MNIQIFGKKKCFDTRKAERYFKERRIKFQSIDMVSKGKSKGELESDVRAVGLKSLIDTSSSLYDEKNIGRMTTQSLIMEILLENPKLIKTPIVRNGQKATVGYVPEVWETWAQ